jgi:hypothetical protein
MGPGGGDGAVAEGAFVVLDHQRGGVGSRHLAAVDCRHGRVATQRFDQRLEPLRVLGRAVRVDKHTVGLVALLHAQVENPSRDVGAGRDLDQLDRKRADDVDRAVGRAGVDGNDPEPGPRLSADRLEGFADHPLVVEATHDDQGLCGHGRAPCGAATAVAGT